jgi:hypothetical protein
MKLQFLELMLYYSIIFVSITPGFCNFFTYVVVFISNMWSQ